MDLSTPVASLTTSLGHADTGIPGLVGDLAPLLTLGAILSLFLGLISRVIGI